MKKTKNMIIKKSDEARELFLCATNEGRLYPAVVSVVRNLAKKYKKGIFDGEKAIEAFYPIATAEAKIYCKEFARVEEYPVIFDVTTRYTAAADMVNYYMEKIENNDL